MAIRTLIEDREKKSFSRHAFLSCSSSGRREVEAACPIRTSFQVDRDRILHSKAFRRLKYKTQVFLSPEGDHYRTRLTHTLEVSQIARTIARALALNEDLAEAIALGHDLGHTPFGHAGERVLNELAPGGFHHVRQSRRVVEVLENDGEGLNLSAEVIDGISKHSKGQGALSKVDREALPATLEGQIVRLADIVAYVNHDLDDALRAGLINADQLPRKVRGGIGVDHELWLNAMIHDIIEVALENDSAVIRFSESFDEIVLTLRDWLFMNVYRVKPVNENFERASHVLRQLFHYFLDNPGALEPLGGRIPTSDPSEIAVTDFIAGMTDRFAINLYNEIFIPRPWSVL